MKSSGSLIKTNVIYGLIVLVPVSILILLLSMLVEILEKIAKPLGLHSATSTLIALIIAFLILLLFCFAVGALVRTKLGSWSFVKFEHTVLKKIPGYQIITNILRGFAENKSAYPSMVQLFGPGTAVMGFVMEENENDLLTIFIPSAPVITAGSVHIVKRERVTLLDAGAIDITECISHWGIGSSKILGG